MELLNYENIDLFSLYYIFIVNLYIFLYEFSPPRNKIYICFFITITILPVCDYFYIYDHYMDVKVHIFDWLFNFCCLLMS